VVCFGYLFQRRSALIFSVDMFPYTRHIALQSALISKVDRSL
jgi:hypothetical protein